MGIIRTLMALAVLFTHSGPLFGLDALRLTGGKIAVQTFYIISGFYMALVLHTKYDFRNSYFTFISNRYLRLLPAYMTVVVLTCSISSIFYLFKHVFIYPFDFWINIFNLSPFTFIFTVLSNIFFIGQDWMMFLCLNNTGDYSFSINFRDCALPAYYALLLPQAWTLGIEFTFYLLAPFIVRLKLLYIILIALCSLGLRCFLNLHYGLSYDPWNYRFFPCELSLFIFGVLSYKFYSWLTSRNDKYLNREHCFYMWVAVVMLIVFYQYLPSSKILSAPFQLFVIEPFYLLIAALLPFVFYISKDIKYDRILGELSYPIYISHFLVVNSLKELGIPVVTKHLGLLSIILAISLSVLLCIFIEIPIDNVRQSFLSKRKTKLHAP